jgi:hypothetical protein
MQPRRRAGCIPKEVLRKKRRRITKLFNSDFARQPTLEANDFQTLVLSKKVFPGHKFAPKMRI